MDINKTLTLAKQLRNHFKIFEELEEFMREAVALQNVVKEFETRKANLEEEIKILSQRKTERQKAFNTMIEKQTIQFGEKEKSLKMETKMKEEELVNRKKEINETIEKMEISLKNAREAHAEEMERMKLEKEAGERMLKAVEKKIKDIKAKL